MLRRSIGYQLEMPSNARLKIDELMVTGDQQLIRLNLGIRMGLYKTRHQSIQIICT